MSHSDAATGFADRLHAHAIPAVRRHYTRADCARYALSVGLGQDPLDAVQLSYVELNHPMQVLPTMAIVLGSPGFWLGEPATGVDIATVLHGEQRLRMHRPLPDEADVIGTTVLERIVDKGPGQAALLFTCTTLVDAASGAVYAQAESTTFIRGAGGHGGLTGPTPAPPALPAGPPAHAVSVATRPEQALWYRLNGDHNPLHADPAVARRAGFDRPILHGLCTLGIACQSVLRTLAGGDATRLASLAARFRAPVFPGETLVTEVWADGAFRARVVERDTVVLTGSVALVPSPA